MSVRQPGAMLRGALIASTAFGLPLAFSTTVQAQDGERRTNVIEEVTVTARRTEETLQEVPVTVTAIGGDTIDKYLIDQVADVQLSLIHISSPRDRTRSRMPSSA